MTQFLEEALRLASLGYHVFQCLPKSKMPNKNTAPEGCNSASSDPNIVRDWWTRFPDCNIGMKCDNLLVNGSGSLRRRNGGRRSIPAAATCRPSIRRRWSCRSTRARRKK